MYLKITKANKNLSGGLTMVNLDFDKFIKTQKKHEGQYLGGGNQPQGINDEEYNNRGNSDKSVGTTGRKI